MFKSALIILFLGAVSVCFGAWSNDPAANAAQLGLTTLEFETQMAYAGTLSGFLLGLFIWKAK